MSDETTGHWSLAAGEHHCLFIAPSGNLYAAGMNHMSQLGLPGSVALASRPVQVPGVEQALQAATGLAHSLVLDRSGQVHAFGDNRHGQLGLPGYRLADKPTRIASLDGIVKVAAAGSHSMALRRDGVLYGWGSNWQGQLGMHEGRYASSPVVLFQGKKVLDFETDSSRTVALLEGGLLRQITSHGVTDYCCSADARDVASALKAQPFARAGDALQARHVLLQAGGQPAAAAAALPPDGRFDAVQRLESGGWIAIDHAGSLEYRGQPCAFAPR